MMEEKAMSEEILVKLDLHAESLGCVVAQIDFNEKRNCSLFHWQIFKSRYLALNFPDVFASPVPQSYQEFQEIIVVAQRELIETGLIDKYLREARLSKKRWTLKASSEAIQAALRYTIIARLSPEWNSVACKAVSGAKNGDMLLRGRNFLVEAAERPIEAVQIRVFVADGVAWLRLRACRSRLLQISLEDLQISAKDVENLFANPNGFVCENQIAAPWVHVIPSLKRGRVTYVSRGFPPDCVFKSFEDLCKHWRKTYGVVLPSLEPSATPIFASVSFLIGSRPFLYPMECLLRTCPQWMRHAKPEPLVLALVESVQKCLQTDITVEVAGRPVVQLVPTNQVNPQQPAPNVQSGPLDELLRRTPATVVSTGEEIVEPAPEPAKPALSTQPCFHFMDRLSKSVRRPFAVLSPNITSRSSVSSSTNQPRAPAKPHALEPAREIFQPLKNKVAAKGPEKPARSLVPPKGIFRPTEKVAKKPAERKPQPKPSADITALFKSGNLKKATVGQLQMWLRENGFEAKGRLKKGELLERVSFELTEKQKEETRPTANTSAASLSRIMSHLRKN